MSFGWLTIFPLSSGWQNVIWTLSHPNESVHDRISSGWLMSDALCHPVELVYVPHPDELRQIHYVIRMTHSSILRLPVDFAQVAIPPGWITANSLCHLDDKSFHLNPSGWDNSIACWKLRQTVSYVSSHSPSFQHEAWNVPKLSHWFATFIVMGIPRLNSTQRYFIFRNIQ